MTLWRDPTSINKFTPRPTHWLKAYLFDVSLIVLTILIFSYHPSFWLFILSVLLIGTRQHGIAVLGHDGTHGTISKTRWVNDLLAKCCFTPLGISHENYRKFHLGHHRFLGTPHNPELNLLAYGKDSWKLPASFSRIILLSAKDFLVWPSLREMIPFMRLTGSLPVTFTNVGFWLLVTVLFGFWPVVLWFMSLFTAFWASNRLRIWQEHQGTTGTHCVKATWWQRFLFLPHSIGWHLEHHNEPRIPFYNLPYVKRSRQPVSVGSLFRTFERI